MQKNEVGPVPHTMYKINSKWTQDIKVITKTIKFLEGKMGINLCDIELGSGFLDLTPEVQMAKEKIDILVLCEN